MKTYSDNTYPVTLELNNDDFTENELLAMFEMIDEHDSYYDSGEL